MLSFCVCVCVCVCGGGGGGRKPSKGFCLELLIASLLQKW